MESKNGEELQEFSKPLLERLQKANIQPTQGGKNDSSNKSIIKSDFNERENANLRSNASIYSILSAGEVTLGALKVWAALPEKIRQDPSFKSFRQEHERLQGFFLEECYNQSFC